MSEPTQQNTRLARLNRCIAAVQASNEPEQSKRESNIQATAYAAVLMQAHKLETTTGMPPELNEALAAIDDYCTLVESTFNCEAA